MSTASHVVGEPGVVLGRPQRATALQSLTLEKCHLDDRAVGALCAGLQRNSSLTCLVLSGNSMQSKGAAALAAALSPAIAGDATGSVCRLRRLDVSWNNVSGDGAVALMGAVASHHTLKVG